MHSSFCVPVRGCRTAVLLLMGVVLSTGCDSDPSGPEAPAPPTDLQATVTGQSIQLTWQASSGAGTGKYRIYRGPETNPSTLIATVPGNQTTYTDTNVEADVTYHYRVTAASAGGAESDFSDDVTAVVSTSSANTCSGGYPCRNVELLTHLPIADLGGGANTSLNDVWGWTDPQTGRQYALVVSEANGHGLQIFDLTALRDASGDTPQTFASTAVYNGFGRAHNVVTAGAGRRAASGISESLS